MEAIKSAMSEAALLELLAEEAVELAKAALKGARILRGENPTPVPYDVAQEHIQEELTDVIHTARVLNIQIDEQQILEKHNRWKDRLKEQIVIDNLIKAINFNLTGNRF